MSISFRFHKFAFTTQKLISSSSLLTLCLSLGLCLSRSLGSHFFLLLLPLLRLVGISLSLACLLHSGLTLLVFPFLGLLLKTSLLFLFRFLFLPLPWGGRLARLLGTSCSCGLVRIFYLIRSVLETRCLLPLLGLLLLPLLPGDLLFPLPGLLLLLLFLSHQVTCS